MADGAASYSAAHQAAAAIWATMDPRSLANAACCALGLAPSPTLSKDVAACVHACTKLYGDDGSMPCSGLVSQLLHVLHMATIAKEKREEEERRQFEKSETERAEVARAAAEAAKARRAAKLAQDESDLRELDPSDARFRSSVLKRLHSVPFLDCTHELFFHGRLHSGPTLPPRCTWRSKTKLVTKLDGRRSSAARLEGTPEGCSISTKEMVLQEGYLLTPSEFQDHPGVQASKLDQLVRLLKVSRRTVVFTGPGLSPADASAEGHALEREAQFKRGRRPSAAHHALVRLYELGLVQSWVQAGRDGLAQKAGFPQAATLEVCGSWFDPSNPAVKPAGTMRHGERAKLAKEAEQADLVLALGVSPHLGADPIEVLVTRAAERSKWGDAGGSLGVVVVGTQQTESDGCLTLRMYGSPNEVLCALIAALGDSTPVASLQPLSWAHVPELVLVPYGHDGIRNSEGAPRMYLDLRPNATVQLLNHNCQCAKHPVYMHIGAVPGQRFRGRELDERAGPGVGYVSHRSPDGSWFTLIIEGVIMSLGAWWLEAAAAGDLASLPLVNKTACFAGQRPPAGPPVETTSIGTRSRAEPLPSGQDSQVWSGGKDEAELVLLRESEALSVALGCGDGEWVAGLDDLVDASRADELGSTKSRRASVVEARRRPKVADEPKFCFDNGSGRSFVEGLRCYPEISTAPRSRRMSLASTSSASAPTSPLVRRAQSMESTGHEDRFASEADDPQYDPECGAKRGLSQPVRYNSDAGTPSRSRFGTGTDDLISSPLKSPLLSRPSNSELRMPAGGVTTEFTAFEPNDGTSSPEVSPSRTPVCSGSGELRSRSRSVSCGSSQTSPDAGSLKSHSSSPKMRAAVSARSAYEATGESSSTRAQIGASVTFGCASSASGAAMASHSPSGCAVPARPSSAFGVRSGSHPSKMLANLGRPMTLRQAQSLRKSDEATRTGSPECGERTKAFSYDSVALGGQQTLVSLQRIQPTSKSANGPLREPFAKRPAAATESPRARRERLSGSAGARFGYEETTTLAEMLAVATQRGECRGRSGSPLLSDHDSSPGHRYSMGIRRPPPQAAMAWRALRQ